MLADAVAELLRHQEVVGHMIVLRTDPGQAQALAVAIDRARPADVAGTIAGDDTILVICRSTGGGRAGRAAVRGLSRQRRRDRT